MGEGEDERPANFDEILEVSGLDAEQVRHKRRKYDMYLIRLPLQD